jgi:protein ImuA
MNKTMPSSYAKRLAALKCSLEKAGLGGMHGRLFAPLGHAEADACLGGGLRLGALHEVFAREANGGAAIGFAAFMLQRCLQHKPQQKHALWIRQDFSALEQGEISAPGFLELGFHPSRLLLMRAADATDALRAGLEALTCTQLGTVILEIPGEPKILDLTATRRLTLAADLSGVTAILLRPCAEPSPSACETRWCVAAASSPEHEEDWGMPRFDAELQRNRHGPTGHWVMEWCGDGVFKEAGRKADSGALAAASFNRPHPAEEGLRRSA